MNPRLRVYSYVVGGVFWIALGLRVATDPSALGALSWIAPLVALAVAGEELLVRQREQGGIAAISFSAVAHIAAALLLDPVAAAATAVLGILISDGLRSDGRRFLLVNSAMFGGSTWIAGLIAQGLLDRGQIDLRDAPVLLLVVAVRYAITTTIFCGGAAVGGGGRFLPLLGEAGVEDLGSALGEGSLGVLVAVAVLHDPVILPFLLPLFAALYLSKANLERLRTETQHALNAMADVIDARDPSTTAHSERVAGYVEQFVEALRLPHRDAERVIATARYHDLGKIAVDVKTLTSAEKLTEPELAQIRQHPRLSAQLLRPFSFARDMADFVELHHERFDGRGYYGVEGTAVPIESHLLIVADSFDAMTSTRAYRPALSIEDALAEVTDKAGTQFHPLVARAFAAVIAGQPLEDHLSRAELLGLGSQFVRRKPVAVAISFRPEPRTALILCVLALLVLVGAGVTSPLALAAPLGIGIGCAAVWARRERIMRRRRQRLALVLDAELSDQAAIAAAAFVGSAGWLPLADDPVLADSLPLRPEELSEAQSWARRRFDAGVVRLSTGASIVLSGLMRDGCHYILVLPGAVRGHEVRLAEAVAASLAAWAPDPRSSDRPVVRSSRGERRAILHVELRIFERVRLGAGQLVAERVVADAELRIRDVLRKNDALVRVGDDEFAISALVSDSAALQGLGRRLAAAIEMVPLPARLEPADPAITAGPAEDADLSPELAAIEARLLPVTGARQEGAPPARR